MKTEFDGEALRKRIDAVILLLLESSPRGASSTVGKIERLLELGFSQPEVAQMIGKKLNYVTAVISKKRSSPSKKETSSEAEE